MFDELDEMDIIYNKNELPVQIKKKKVQEKGSWPLRTKICCWWCVHTFDTVPCPTIKRYNSKNQTYHVEGVFCSWNCAKAYIIKNKKSHITSLGLQTFLHQKFQKKTSRIKPSPSMHILKTFGGDLTIEEYRKRYATHVCIREETEKNISELCIEQYNEEPDYSYDAIFGFVSNTEEQKTVSNEVTKLKLKRSKPIKSKGTLQQTMGLIINQ